MRENWCLGARSEELAGSVSVAASSQFVRAVESRLDEFRTNHERRTNGNKIQSETEQREFHHVRRRERGEREEYQPALVSHRSWYTLTSMGDFFMRDYSTTAVVTAEIKVAIRNAEGFVFFTFTYTYYLYLVPGICTR